MKRTSLYIFTLLFVFVTLSCKNDKEDEAGKDDVNTENSETVEEKAEVVTPVKRELTDDDRKVLNSVFARLMTTKEVSTYASVLVTAGLNEILLNESGPYTILGPSNEAFNKVPREKMRYYQNTANIEAFKTLAKNHIVEGSIDSATLVQDIKNKGSVTLTTMAGSELTAKMNGTDITITDSEGNQATIGKSDINASNGVVHILDTVLEGVK